MRMENLGLTAIDLRSKLKLSHNGHMIKFQFFEKSSSLNCHFKNLGTFVVSISHYMRAYFNYKALEDGSDFDLPGDVGFLNVSQIRAKVMEKRGDSRLACLAFLGRVTV